MKLIYILVILLLSSCGTCRTIQLDNGDIVTAMDYSYYNLTDTIVIERHTRQFHNTVTTNVKIVGNFINELPKDKDSIYSRKRKESLSYYKGTFKN